MFGDATNDRRARPVEGYDAELRSVRTAIDGLAEDPSPRGARALVNRPGLLRLRVGNYSVVYEVRDRELLVLVIDLGHRGDVHR